MNPPKTNKPKTRLKNLDNLYELNSNGEQTEEKLSAGADNQNYNEAPMVKRQSLTFTRNVALTELHPFQGHPFREYEGERLDDMVESIRSHGVLVPIIVRSTDLRIEILAGHNRVKAAKLVGLSTVPAIILEDISDEEAWF